MEEIKSTEFKRYGGELDLVGCIFVAWIPRLEYSIDMLKV
jgi:hypothetical protein